jgi:hypothetical protein
MSEPGAKYDVGKPRLDLLPASALLAVGQVLAYGAAKYVANGWQHVPDAEARYRAALLRHQLAIMEGETHDAESGLRHSAHVACNALFLLWFELRSA